MIGLTLRRSILTEKVSRRGYHLSREYAVDPLETLLVQDVMRTRLIALSGGSSMEEVRNALKQSHGPQGQQLYPVLDHGGSMRGAVHSCWCREASGMTSKIVAASAPGC